MAVKKFLLDYSLPEGVAIIGFFTAFLSGHFFIRSIVLFIPYLTGFNDVSSGLQISSSAFHWFILNHCQLSLFNPALMTYSGFLIVFYGILVLSSIRLVKAVRQVRKSSFLLCGFKLVFDSTEFKKRRCFLHGSAPVVCCFGNCNQRVFLPRSWALHIRAIISFVELHGSGDFLHLPCGLLVQQKWIGVKSWQPKVLKVTISADKNWFLRILVRLHVKPSMPK